ncbi:universal stress protein [Arthrobacter sp. NyZ413]|uniref:universal stress protein n=1 Tax=Arthrobacter sp. NyZ413 TaxID=3144669 RepID=UPI003BF809A0
MNGPIVVGISDSAASEPALVWAVRRAARLKVPVLLVHAIDDRWMSRALEYTEPVRTAGLEVLSKAKARAQAVEPDVDVETLLFAGSTGMALRERSKGASLVVVGPGHAWPGGPVTDRALQIVAVSKCPVAVIGSQDPAGRHGVVVGVDGSEESARAVSFAAAEADRDGQDLTVLSALRLPVVSGVSWGTVMQPVLAEERRVLAESAAGLAEDFPDLVVRQVLVSDKDPEDALVDAASHAKLLVLGSRGRGSFKRLLLGSTAHAILRNSPCPTIITRVRKVRNA